MGSIANPRHHISNPTLYYKSLLPYLLHDSKDYISHCTDGGYASNTQLNSHLMSGILLFFTPMFSLFIMLELPGLPSPMLLLTKLSFFALLAFKDSFRLVGLLMHFEEPSYPWLGLTDSLTWVGLGASLLWLGLKASFPCCCLYGRSATGLLTPFTVGILPVVMINYWYWFSV